MRLYRDHSNRLLNTGHAYRCFCTKERLDQLAQHRKTLGLSSDYDRVCASISREQSDERATRGESHVIRLLAPESYPTFYDNVYGVVGREQKGPPRPKADLHGNAGHEDPVLLKSDGWPTYHFANVVDDHFMDITHVIRGTEWLSSTPKHLALYDAFGWEPPNYAHIALLVDKEGQKLSKRNNDMDMTRHLQQGFLPDAMINFVALLGWSHSSTTDVMDLGQLVGEVGRVCLSRSNTGFTDIATSQVSRRFSAGRDMAFTKGNAIVDPGKLVYLNTAHSRRVTLDYLQNPHKEHKTLDAMIYQVMQCLPDILPTLYGDQKGKPKAQWQAKLPVPQKFDLVEYVRQLLLCAAGNYKTPGDFSYGLRYFFSEVPFERADELAKPSTRKHIMQSFRDKAQPIADAASVNIESLHLALDSLFKILYEKDVWNSDDLVTNTISCVSRTLSQHLESSAPASALRTALATASTEMKESAEYGGASSPTTDAESTRRPSKTEKDCRRSFCAYARLVLMDGLNGPGIHATITLLGRQVCMRRFEAATALLQRTDAPGVDLPENIEAARGADGLGGSCHCP